MINKAAMLLDASRCMACRGCQVACKSWNGLPAVTTTLSPSWTNPPDTSAKTYTIIKFQEVAGAGQVKWLFRKEQCRHCTEPGCLGMCPVEGAIEQKPYGAVVVNPDKCAGGSGCALECKDGCPYGIPRFEEKAEPPTRMAKCTFCFDRIEEGLEPACAKACPTDAILFGEAPAVKAEAEKRLAALKAKCPDAALIDIDGTNCFYLLGEKQEVYGFAPKRAVPTRLASRKKGMSPLFLPFMIGSVAVSAVISRRNKVAGEKGKPAR